MPTLNLQNRSAIKLGILLGLVVALTDLAFKFLAVDLVLNSNAALGIASHNSLMALVQILIILIWGIYLMFSESQEFPKLEICIITLLVTASLSNLLDRIMLGGVRDYIFALGFWFNLADFTITSGIMALFVRQLYARIQSNPNT